MDIRFLKKLSGNVGYSFPKHVNFSQTPSVDIVSVGIGQVIKNHAIYVPIHGINSPYNIKKIVCQQGGSNKRLENESNLNSSNETKVAIDEPIKVGFQHPIIKTKTLKLQPKKKVNKIFKFKVVD